MSKMFHDPAHFSVRGFPIPTDPTNTMWRANWTHAHPSSGPIRASPFVAPESLIHESIDNEACIPRDSEVKRTASPYLRVAMPQTPVFPAHQYFSSTLTAAAAQ